MKIEEAFQTETEMESRVMLSKTVDYHSNFRFLQEHRGWRSGNVHTLLGATSSGKSTLVRSLLIDAMCADMNVLLWLSEERIETFKTELAFYGIANKAFSRLKIVSEQDSPKGIHMLGSLKKMLTESSYDLLVVDNLTTSRFYGSKRPNEQDDIVYNLKNIATETNTAMLLVCHTSSSVVGGSKKMISESDIRGSRTVSNISEFFYTLQKLDLVNGDQVTVLRTIKHRGQDVVNKVYRFSYNSKRRTLEHDIPISYENFKLLTKRTVDL